MYTLIAQIRREDALHPHSLSSTEYSMVFFGLNKKYCREQLERSTNKKKEGKLFLFVELRGQTREATQLNFTSRYVDLLSSTRFIFYPIYLSFSLVIRQLARTEQRDGAGGINICFFTCQR